MTSQANGFSNNPFMIGYDNRIFEGDENLGFKFPQGKLISTIGFISLDQAIKGIRTGYPTFLNLGDSSTSGWNSNRVFKGNQDPNAPFFSYKTYSYLQEKCLANVINGGVPGYTSHQGRRYLELLLRKLSKHGVKMDYATIYFGNNDCTYNQQEDKVALDAKMPSKSSRGERVSIDDYKRNIEFMVEDCRSYGIKPILIMPLTHYDWEPGIRADEHREESLEVLRNLNNPSLAKELEIARAFYLQGKYERACERDRVLPRLKSGYRRVLLQVARQTKTDLVDVQDQIPMDNNSRYFADYCHPTEEANQMIVNEILKIRNRDLFHKPFFERVRQFFTLDKNQECGGPSPKVYTLY